MPQPSIARARRRIQVHVETERRTEQLPPTKRRRRNGVRRRNNGEQRNGEPQPVNGKSEGRSLSVIASSVMALGVLPGAEIKLILENLCASLLPDEFKAFLLAIGANLVEGNIIKISAATWASIYSHSHRQTP